MHFPKFEGAIMQYEEMGRGQTNTPEAAPPSASPVRSIRNEILLVPFSLISLLPSYSAPLSASQNAFAVDTSILYVHSREGGVFMLQYHQLP